MVPSLRVPMFMRKVTRSYRYHAVWLVAVWHRITPLNLAYIVIKILWSKYPVFILWYSSVTQRTHIHWCIIKFVEISSNLLKYRNIRRYMVKIDWISPYSFKFRHIHWYISTIVDTLSSNSLIGTLLTDIISLH